MKKNILILLLLSSTSLMLAQQKLKVGNNPATLNPSAALEVESTTKGFLPPRMTSVQKDAISVTTATKGLTVYCTDCTPEGLYTYNGTAWTAVGSLSGASLGNGKILIGNSANAATAIAPTGDVTIDNTGVTAIGAAKVTNGMLQGSIDLTAKVTGVLPVANGGTGTASITGFLKGNGSGAFTSVSKIQSSDVDGVVKKVNGSTPDQDGTVTVPFGSVETGVFTSRKAILDTNNGDIFVTSGETGVEAVNNGRTYISTGSTGSWNEVTSNLASTDNRYVKLSGSEMDGNLTFPTGKKLTIADVPTSSTDVANKKYVDDQDLLKSPLASPVFTGTPDLPAGTKGVTQTAGDNSIKLATTAFVSNAVATATPDANATVKGKVQLAGELSGTADSPTVTNAAVIGKVLTGYVSGSGTISSLDSVLGAIQKVDGNVALKAPIASPVFTGTPDLPAGTKGVTQTAGDNSIKLATTAFVSNAVATATPDANATVKGKIQLAGDLSGTAAAPTVTNAAVIGKVLTGFTSASGTVSATDTVLGAIQKVDGNVALKAPLASPTFTGIATAPTFTSTASTGTAPFTVASTTPVANLTATNATNTTITDDTTTAVSVYPTFVTANTGNLPQKVASTKLSFVPSTGILTATKFSGDGSGLAGIIATTNASLTGPITSVGNATAVASQTGTGSKFVMDTSPTLVTPTLGVATATSINGLTPTAQTTGFTIAGGTTSKTLTVSGDATVSGSNTGDQTNISGNAATATSIAGGTLGAVPYQSAAGTTNFLAGNTTSTSKFLTSTGDGTTAAAPAWTNFDTVAVPYTGATKAVDLGDYDLTVNGLTVGKGGNRTQENTAVGKDALKVNTSGANNTAIGKAALTLNTSGANNTAIGASALTANTIGGSNIAIGESNLMANTIGSSNIAIGNTALQTNTNSSFNTAVGDKSLKDIDNFSNSNIGIGYHAGFGLISGANNIFIGSQDNATGMRIGVSNTIIGSEITGLPETLNNNIILADGTGNIRAQHDGISWDLKTTIKGVTETADDDSTNLATTAFVKNAVTTVAIPYTGATAAVDLGAHDLTVNGLTVGKGGDGKQPNVVVGLNSLSSNTTGFNNTAIGNTALNLNTTGYNNTAIGFATLGSNTEGSFNTAIGNLALSSNTSGVFNTAVGYGVLTLNTSGAKNTAVGYNALKTNETGGFNTALGNTALTLNTSGSNNTAVGYNALSSNTSGASNTAVGYGVLTLNKTGKMNTSFGHNALYTNNGDENISIGYSNFYNMDNSNGNILIGNSGNNLTSGNYNTIIGSKIYTPLASLSNNIILADGEGNIRARYNDGWTFGNVTLPTSTTTATLATTADINFPAISSAAKTAAYTALPSDYTILCDASTVGFTLTIPAAATANTGKMYVINKIDDSTNALTFSPALKLSSTTTVSSVNFNQTLRIQSDGTNWWIIN